MKLLVTKAFFLSLAYAPARANLFNSDVPTELRFCCQAGECYSACTVLCNEFMDTSFCIDGANHPANRANGNEMTYTVAGLVDIYMEMNPDAERPDLGDGFQDFDFVVEEEGETEPNVVEEGPDGEDMGDFFGRGRRLGFGFKCNANDRRRRLSSPVEHGCGEPPAGPVPRPVDGALPADSEWAVWGTCIVCFIEGNEYTRRHCVKVLPQLNNQCLYKGTVAVEVGGEPHFKTWMDTWYDYHGECDLKMLHAPSFAEGLGLDIHIRTKIRDHYSFIESVAIKIGSDVLEVAGWGQYIYNGVAGGNLKDAVMGKFEVTHDPQSKRVHHFHIGEGYHVVKVKTTKDFVSVSLGDEPQPEDYSDSEGMLGQYGTGTLFGRDGTTIFTEDNINDFGQEWQLRPDEPKLFENKERGPQFPAQCLLPAATTKEKRRLGERVVSEEEAEKACSGWAPSSQPKCVYDVLATGDLELAEAGSY